MEPLSDALPDAEGKRTFGDDECDLVTFVELGVERSLGRSSRDAAAIAFCRGEGAAARRDPAGGGRDGADPAGGLRVEQAVQRRVVLRRPRRVRHGGV